MSLGCDDMIENLTKEKSLFTDNICARQEVVNDSEKLVEINEPYDEVEQAAWNGKVLSNNKKILLYYATIKCIHFLPPDIHKQKVKEYKKRLAEEKKKQELEHHQKVLNEFKSVGFDDKLSGLKRPTLFTASAVHYSIINGFVLGN